MAKVNCNSCDELREKSPNLIVNGLGDTECTSLANNTGLNPSSGNDDCTDLHNLNDCLIGNMEQEIDAYDVCDWKEYMRKYVENSWTVFKGIICAVCGLWTQIADLRSLINAVCEMQSTILQPPTLPHGVLPHNTSSSRYGGTIATKNGKPVFVEIQDISPELLPIVGVGLAYGKLKTINCSTGRCILREWYAPYFYGYRINPDVTLEFMDELYRVNKTKAQSWGITDSLWNARAIVPIGWGSEYFVLNTALVGIRMSIEGNDIVLRYYGQIGATDAALSGNRLDNPSDGGARMHTSNC